MVLPAFVIVLLFNYLPMYGLQLAFRDFDPARGLTGGEFVGLEYFQRFFQSHQFWDLIRNTFLISLYSLLVGFPVPILIALIFNQIRNARRKNLMQTVVYIPHFISVIAIVGMLIVFLSPSIGIVGNLLSLFGIEPINFMGETEYFRSIFVMSEVWQHAGWNSIIYIAALSGINPQLYEAAKVDGASRLQQVIHIDIPYLIPTMIILLILNAGSLLGVGFEKIFLMQNNMNLPVSEVIETYVYKIGILSNQISYSTAIGFFNTMINFLILLIVNQIAKKTSENSLW
ncbi:ABC transporter permease [Gracilibacillus phocaeensis]|uniref:ABC transporter permease n=1 Tax=Gracilibacillus phocaeensis TaxID=2042304 RepID=UPI00102FEAD2|nr:ABC transporter permease subunit [Gracilibacillus phocaeensis]